MRDISTASAAIGGTLPGKQSSPIETELQVMQQRIEVLGENLNSLANRISPITVPVPSGGADVCEKDGSICVIGEAIRTQRRQIDSLIERVQLLKDSVQL